jgi:hypothetical protein
MGGRGPENTPQRRARDSEKVEDVDQEGTWLGCHVLDIRGQEILVEKRMLGMSGYGLDEILVIGGGVEGLIQVSQICTLVKQLSPTQAL